MNVILVKSFINIIFQTEVLTFFSLTNSECKSKCTNHAAAMLDLSHDYDLFVEVEEVKFHVLKQIMTYTK